ncbi:histidine kinase [Parendozoicomonas haliclonae]|uniref:Sensor protein n=1 Tax=Parendozoicomonas haliclonae TaxID=1960125 RepID=A0A1X7AF50_9GAMM|nr:histidine kinase [Parendozoicomonas haliclonae]SMA35143.1 Nitrate/nitrite sensor protein NarX [Parendozoicomonas haliclonae]
MTIHSRLRLMILSITALAATVIGISLTFIEQSETDAAAINVAGSLRMQTWRIAEHVVVAELVTEEILAPLVDVYDLSIHRPSLTLLNQRGGKIQEQYQDVVFQWEQVMRPRLVHRNFAGYVEDVPAFVDKIDRMVFSLQQDNEEKLNVLFTAMLVALGLLLFISILIFWDVRRNILTPVRLLMQASRDVRKGTFDIHIPYRGNNELGHLSGAFTKMASDLKLYYQQLEEKVAEQTKALTQSNAALELLYESSEMLASNPFNQEVLKAYLGRWQKLLNLQECYVCLTTQQDMDWLERIAAPGSLMMTCADGHCSSCLSCGDKLSAGGDSLASIQFVIKGSGGSMEYGFLRATPARDQLLTEEERQWIQLFVDVIGKALGQYRKRELDRRILLMEERTVIARELHDSLAQSLSYQKIQLARIQRLTQQGEDPEKVKVIVEDLQEAVASAYKHLRELLVTFRLSMGDGTLRENIERTLEGFSKQSKSLTFDLDYRIRFLPLDAHQEVHILQIIREALNNVVQHSQATRSTVRCYQEDHEIVVSVTDNGCGLSESPEKAGHYGLSIMSERANSLGGHMSYVSTAAGGVRVELRFPVAETEEQDMNNDINKKHDAEVSQ